MKKLIPFLCLLGLPLQARELSPELAQETFLEVWEKIDASFYDRTFNGLDWKAIKTKYQSQVDEAESNAELRVVLNAMLGELGRSHFGVIGTSPAKKTPGTKGTYLGLQLRHREGSLIIYEIAPRSPAAKAGMTPGMEILTIEDEPVADLLKRHTLDPKAGVLIVYKALEEILEQMGAPVDGKITLKVGDREEPFDFAPGRYKGERASMGSGGRYPVSFKTKLIPGDQNVRLIDFDIFLPSLMPRLNKAVAQAQSENAEGLIIDLRGNPGGLGIMATGLVGRLIDKELDLGDMNNPSGNLPFHAFPQENAYLGPVAVLVDTFSASTSEIFAAALQEHKRARIIGRPTMAAVLPSMIDKLSNGDRLQYAIGDFVTAVNKVHLEGRGVTPDELIPINPAAMREGRDPDLEAALRWLKTQKTTTQK
ncbi:MAG: S41 family peptidase [Akkermansiaceae bacterium]|jgi:carboxyl-terminal processing protease